MKKTPIKELLIKYGQYLLWFQVFTWAAIFISMGIVLVSELIFDVSELGERILYGVLLTFLPVPFIYKQISKMGFKDGEFRKRDIIIAASMVFGTRQLLSLLIGYTIYFAGGAYYFAHAICLGNTEAEFAQPFEVVAMCIAMHVLMAVIDFLIYLPVCIKGESSGVKLRGRQRSELGYRSEGEI